MGINSEVVAMEFIDPYPVLAASYLDGSFCLWGMRDCDNLIKYTCLMHTYNFSLEDNEHTFSSISSIVNLILLNPNFEPKRTFEENRSDRELEEFYTKFFKEDEKQQLTLSNINKEGSADYLSISGDSKMDINQNYLFSPQKNVDKNKINFTHEFDVNINRAKMENLMPLYIYQTIKDL